MIAQPHGTKEEQRPYGMPFLRLRRDGGTNSEGEKPAAGESLGVHEQVMDRATVALAALDLTGCFTFVNRRACEIAGYTSDELIGRHYWSLLLPEQVPAVTRQFARVIERGMNIPRMETHLLRKDGGRRILSADLGPLLEHETVIGAVCSAEDVTDRQRVEQYFLAMQAVAQHAADAVLIADAEALDPLQARIVYTNPAFTRLTGYTETDALRQALALLFAETRDPAPLSALADAWQRHEAVDLEIQLRRADGAWRWVNAAFVPVRNSSQQFIHWIVIQRDITNQRVIEAVTTRLEREISSTLRALRADRGVSALVGVSPKMRALRELVLKVARDPTVTALIQGASGTGKELVAKAIHYESARAARPFVAVNCANLPRDLLETELFGHERGSFTNATRAHQGFFEQAQSGTLFLDEISELDMSLQPKLLRAIQERTIRHLGGSKDVDVDVRVLAASNRNLNAEIAAGRFREDLFYRLAVVEIVMPTLKELGPDDIARLADHFVWRMCAQRGRPPVRLAPMVIRTLQQYDWPGNVRQLQNVIERLVVESEGDVIEIDRVPRELLHAAGATAPAHVSVKAIRRVLRRHDNNITKAAKALGFSRNQLYRRMHKLGIVVAKRRE